MTSPTRIQFRRGVRGWRLPEGAVVITRSTRWGNPFLVKDYEGRADPLGACLADYQRWLDGDPTFPDQITPAGKKRTFDRRWVRAHIHELAGLDLACTCKDGERCHGDLLLERAAGEAEDAATVADVLADVQWDADHELDPYRPAAEGDQ